MKKRIVMVLLLAMLAACQSSEITTGVLEVENAWARPALQGDNGAVYLVIENGTPQDDRLISVKTEIALASELHLSLMEGDHMSMNQQEQVLSPASKAVEFTPGGLHIMLVGLARELKPGETFDITLVFEHAGDTIVTVTVRDDVNDD